MGIGDLKLYIFNSLALAITFANIEMAMKLTLLTVSILYTVLKILELKKNKNKDNNEESN